MPRRWRMESFFFISVFFSYYFQCEEDSKDEKENSMLRLGHPRTKPEEEGKVSQNPMSTACMLADPWPCRLVCRPGLKATEKMHPMWHCRVIGRSCPYGPNATKPAFPMNILIGNTNIASFFVPMIGKGVRRSFGAIANVETSRRLQEFLEAIVILFSHPLNIVSGVCENNTFQSTK